MRIRITDRHLALLKLGPEDREQMNFVEWLESKGYKYTSVPNSTFTRSWKQKTKNALLGLNAGFPDLVVIAEGKFMAIELKRAEGGNMGTKAQREWVAALNEVAIPTKICKGCEEAIEFVKHVINSN